MSYNARVFRILIASPGDVSEEREIAVSTIQAWNDLNSSERQLVLLPMRWETHSAPEYGRRPQEVINRQIVDHCDLLVGVFWTRIGTPTGKADSGTLEEIERVANQGKPVMLYFSRAKQDPENIDIDQLQRLREFKKKTFPNALIEGYSSQVEFRDKLAKQLEIQLRSLLTEAGAGDSVDGSPQFKTDIKIEFANAETGKSIGSELDLHLTSINVTGIDALPDYQTKRRSKNGLVDIGRDNADYYRNAAAFYARKPRLVPVRFWLRNSGGLGARDVYVDIRITADDSAKISAQPFSAAALTPPHKDWTGTLLSLYGGDKSEAPERVGGEWTTKLELSALQPKREMSPPPVFVLSATEGGTVTIAAKVFADVLPEPVTHILKINLTVDSITKSAREILEEEGIKIPAPAIRSVTTDEDHSA